MHPQDLIPQPVQFSWCTVFSSHLLQHPLSMHHINSLVRNIYKFPSHPPLLPQHCSPVHSALAWLVALPRSRERVRWYFQLPAPHPILISTAVSVAAPAVCGCAGAPGCVTASPQVQATWPTVQFRQLTKSGSPGFVRTAPGFVNRTEQSRATQRRLLISALGSPSLTHTVPTHTSVPSASPLPFRLT